MTTTDDRAGYSISEAAALLGVSRVSIWRWIRAGRLPVARLGHRTTRIRRADLERLLLDRALVQLGPSATRAWVARTLSATLDTVGHIGTGEGPSRHGRSFDATDHVVQFYETDAFLLDAVASFIGESLSNDAVGIVIATPLHRAGVDDRLQRAGLDMVAARADGRYVTLDAAEMLARLVVDDALDPARFVEVVGGMVRHAAASGRRVRIFGEMVALLVGRGNPDAALRLEGLWNDLQRHVTFALFCAYPLDQLAGETAAALFDHVCTEHTRVLPAESYTALSTADDRLRAIATLQQRAQSLRTEIEGRKRVEAELQQRDEVQQRLAAIVDSSDDAIIGKTLDAVITNWNAAAERMYGYSAEEAIGRSIGMLVPPDRPDELPAIMARLRRGERIANYETVRVRTDGTRLAVSLTISPIRDTTGTLVGASTIARDITSRKRAEAALREAMAARDQALGEAQAALRVRDEFLGSITHDLRTPLSSIKGLTQLLLRQATRTTTLDTARMISVLTSIDTATSTMAAMIDELLDLTRLQAGQALELDRQPTDLVALVQTALADWQRTAPDHRLVMDTTLPSLHGQWDRPRLGRVIANLLSNAVKYSPEGGTITVTLTHEETDVGAWATVTVRDEGVGIPLADLPYIFDRFHRGANVIDRTRGVGIGLAGCKSIVELHGGAIIVASEEGAGTTVTLRLPCAALEPCEGSPA